MENKDMQLDSEQLKNVSGGQWTPGWVEESWEFVPLKRLLGVVCGCCGQRGYVYKGYYKQMPQCMNMRCDKCGASTDYTESE